jgi:hypothetical protein
MWFVFLCFGLAVVLGIAEMLRNRHSHDSEGVIDNGSTSNQGLMTYRNESVEVSPQIRDNIQTLFDYYDPSSGKLSSWWQRGKAESRARLLGVLNQEQLLIIEQGAILEDKVREGQKRESDFLLYVANNAHALSEIRHKESLIDKALAKGRSVETDQKLILEEGLSNIRVNEHEAFAKIDVAKDYETRMNQLKGILAVKLFPHARLKEMRGMVKDLLTERHEVEVSELPTSVKREYKKLLDGTIDAYKKAYNDGQVRLLQGADGEDVGSANEDADI